VAVIVTLYDESDHVVGSRTVNIPAEVFISGATAPFDVELAPLGEVATYDLQVQGWWVGYSLPDITGTPAVTASP